ncbi:hypothetical protein ACLBOM_05685 [Escherichia coli]
MVDTEIWLRLMSISSLYGDDMVRISSLAGKTVGELMRLDCSKQGLHCGRHNAFFHFRERVSKAHFVGSSNPTII